MTPRSIAIKSNLQRRGFFDVGLSGLCMYPILKEGDCARIIAATKLSVGDICVFEDETDQLLAHRIICLRRDEIRVKGDHSNSAELIKPESILGVIVAVKLSGSDAWTALPNKIPYRRIAAFLSKRMIHECDYTDVTLILKAQRLLRRFNRHILILLNSGMRKRIELLPSVSISCRANYRE